VALVTQQVPPLIKKGVSFRSLTPSLRRHSSMAWRAGAPSENLAEFIHIVQDLHLVD
jgi:hypothetical protein